MSLVIRKKPFVPAPDGIWPAVCVDVVDLGLEQSPWGPLDKCRVVWEISAVMPESGNRFIVGEKYTKSLSEKANLFKMLKTWRGRAFTAEELKAFDLENIVGKPCQLVVTHEDGKEGNVFAKVTTVLKVDPKNILTPSGKYQRVKDREGYVPPVSADAGQDEAAECLAAQDEEASSVPF